MKIYVTFKYGESFTKSPENEISYAEVTNALVCSEGEKQ